MGRGTGCALLLLFLLLLSVEAGATTLVLPLRTTGVSDTTAAVVRELLAGELESREFLVARPAEIGGLPEGADACDDAGCAEALARQRGASLVVYGSLSRLGEKIIVRVRALRVGEAGPFYQDQLSAQTEEDLDAVMRRVADGIVAGRANSDRATVDTVTLEETEKPRRREGRSGIGLRAGSIFPDGDSYGGERLTSLRIAYKFETRDFLIESTALLGMAWGGESTEWTPLDVFAARIFGRGDAAIYLGGGLGLRSLKVKREIPCASEDPYYCYGGVRLVEQTATTLSADAGIGVILFRTYSYQILCDVRYHYVFEDFEKVEGKGAHGLAVTFGTSH